MDEGFQGFLKNKKDILHLKRMARIPFKWP